MATREDLAENLSRARQALWPTVVGAGLLCATLDIVFIISVWWPLGVPPQAILQTIASGLLGPKAFALGNAGSLLGLALHFAMMVGIAAAYIVAAPAVIRSRPWTGGTLYGSALWLIMNMVVVPLSAAPIGLSPAPIVAAEIAAHVFLVGLPIAFIARRRDGTHRLAHVPR